MGIVAMVDQTVEARAVDNSNGNALVFATFHATALPGAAKGLSITTQPAAVVKAAEVAVATAGVAGRRSIRQRRETEWCERHGWDIASERAYNRRHRNRANE